MVLREWGGVKEGDGEGLLRGGHERDAEWGLHAGSHGTPHPVWELVSSQVSAIVRERSIASSSPDVRRGPSIGPQLGYMPPEAQKPTPACGCLSLPVWSRGVSLQVGEFILPPREGWLLTLGAPAQALWSRRVEGGCGIPSVSSPIHFHSETSVPPEPCGVLGHLCPGLLAQSCHPVREGRQMTVWSAVRASRPPALGEGASFRPCI